MLISQNLRVSLFGNLVTSDKQLSNRIFFALQITDQDRTYTYLSGKYSFDEPVYAVQEKFRNGEYGDLVANLVHDAEENPERFFVA
ncbi:MAG TPA: hypothetical protein PK765_06840 [bacterium]|nr:hypothetical protein [bacterium]